MYTWQLTDRTINISRRPLIMGIVNVTPDSFSDGGKFIETAAAVAHGLELARQGADLLDVGGESTRPGSEAVPLEEELRRVVPVVHALVNQVSIPISIDTSKAKVARECLSAGAHIVNDVTALTGDPEMAAVVRNFRTAVILMHMRGSPATMQINPTYDDAVVEIRKYLEDRLHSTTSVGIAAEQVALDPGIGFGKTAPHNLELVARLHELQGLGRPVCLGISRKGFVGKLLGDRPVERRLAGTLAATCYAMSRGAAQIVRVHDVEATRDAVTMFETLSERASSE